MCPPPIHRQSEYQCTNPKCGNVSFAHMDLPREGTFVCPYCRSATVPVLGLDYLSPI